MTVTIASPSAEPGIWDMVRMLLLTAFAAIATVPNEAISPATMIFPMWKIPFSSPLGMPNRRIFRIISRSNRNPRRVSRCRRLCGFRRKKRSSAVPHMRAISEPSAAPATPIRNTKIKSALKPMLVTFITSAANMEMREFPCTRKSAADTL